MTTTCRILAAATIAGSLALFAPAAEALTYIVTDIGALAGGQTGGRAINSSGQVIGFSAVDGVPTVHAVRWNGAALVDLGALGGAESDGLAINVAGQATGWSYTATAGVFHAFRHTGAGPMAALTPLIGYVHSQGTAINAAGTVAGYSANEPMPGSYTYRATVWAAGGTVPTDIHDAATFGGAESEARAINDAGQATGWAETLGGASHAFRHTGGGMQDLGTLAGGANSRGIAINAAGQIAGVSDNAGGGETAVRWTGTTIEDIGTLGGADSTPNDINAAGIVVGSADTASPGVHRAFYYDGAIHEIPALATAGFTGVIAEANAINDAGLIVGYWEDAAGLRRAFLYDLTTGAIVDLDELIALLDPAFAGWNITNGFDVSEAGHIMVFARPFFDGPLHTLVLTPLSEPATPALLGLALIAIAALRRRRAP